MSIALTYTREILRSLYDLFLPGVCVTCKKKTDKIRGLICRECVSALTNRGGREFTLEDKFGLNQVKYVYPYKELNGIELGSAVRELKYSGYQSLAEELAVICASIVSRDPFYRNADAITAVPLHPIRFRERGFNQAELVARRISALVDIPYRSLLERTKNKRPQVELPADKREFNVKGIYKPNPTADCTGERIILFDDQVTSGYTMSNAAGALINCGADRVLGLSLTH